MQIKLKFPNVKNVVKLKNFMNGKIKLYISPPLQVNLGSATLKYSKVMMTGSPGIFRLYPTWSTDNSN